MSTKKRFTYTMFTLGPFPVPPRGKTSTDQFNEAFRKLDPSGGRIAYFSENDRKYTILLEHEVNAI